MNACRRCTSPTRSCASLREDGSAHLSVRDVVPCKRVAGIAEDLLSQYDRDALVPLQYTLIHRPATRHRNLVVKSSAP